MPFGPFALQWRAPSPNPPLPKPLPSGILRTYVQTPSGPLELLSSLPITPTSKPPIFFAHGGFGCASVWLAYLTFFSSHGYPCYALSYRGHGGSWYPGFLAMCFTGIHAIGEDLVAGINAVEKLEQERSKAEEKVHDAFFTADTPIPVVQDLERLLAPYESICWPVQALSPFVTGPDVVSRITGWKARKTSFNKADVPSGITPRFLVLAAEHDVLCTPALMEDAAKRYRAAFHHCVRVGKLDGVSEHNVRIENSDEEGEDRDGVAFTVVKGLGHHLQNHVEWERGANTVLKWVEEL